MLKERPVERLAFFLSLTDAAESFAILRSFCFYPSTDSGSLEQPCFK
jgi:hypothetical protein